MESDAQEGDGLQFGQVEAVLTRVLNIGTEGQKMLRARLNHLRNLGIPDLPRSGSGNKLLYSKDHVLEMLIAVGLENVGQTPRMAIAICKDVIESIHSQRGSKSFKEKNTKFFMVIKSSGCGLSEWSYSIGTPYIESMFEEDDIPPIFSVIDVKRCMDKLDIEYARYTRKGRR